MKVVPPEREVIRALSKTAWASAGQVADAMRWPSSRASAKLRRLQSLGLVESMPGQGSRVYRLTRAGADWRAEHLPQPWVSLAQFTGTPIHHVLRNRDTKQLCTPCYPWTGTGPKRYGVEYGDGRFVWELADALEVQVA